MQFNNFLFIFYFLPISVLLYYVANRFHNFLGKIAIIIASIFFYAYGKWDMLIYLGISMLINYCSALAIKKLKFFPNLALSLPIIVNIVLLLYFKYLNFTIANINSLTHSEIPLQQIILPLGISFYTFQQIAYLVAVSNDKLDNISLIDYLSYILFFPKLVMGPITDPVDFIAQLNDDSKKKANLTNIVIGIKLFSLGLAKKAILADTFAKAVHWVNISSDVATSMDYSLLLLFYTFEIYFDFSGYSDMAVGVASMFNIDLPMNFDSPYKAISIRDFWKRWHISLTKFLTKYIYIPLGGSKKGVLFTYINTIIVFLVSGLWHGANWTFILWGFLHGLLSCFDRLFEKRSEKVFLPIRWFCTFLVVNILWLLFNAESVDQWKNILLNIIYMQDTRISEGLIEVFNLPENQFIYDLLRINYLPSSIRGFSMIIFVIFAFIICFIPENNYRNKDIINFSSLILASLSFIWGILFLGTESIFVYFGF